MKRLIVVAILASCAGKSDSGTGTGTGTGTVTCEDVREHVGTLYAGNADDVAMVMRDCAADPGVAACAKAATSAAELEQRCLIPLDEEGSEGDRFKVR